MGLRMGQKTDCVKKPSLRELGKQKPDGHYVDDLANEKSLLDLNHEMLEHCTLQGGEEIAPRHS